MRERLRASLHDLADDVVPADLHERALRRSRRIARREATVGTVAAVAALGLLASGLWQLPGRSGNPPRAAVAPTSLAPGLPIPASRSAGPETARPERTSRAAGRPEATHRATVPPPSPAAAKPRSRTLADLPGQVFYQGRGDRPDVIRMAPGRHRTETVLADAPSPVGVSPDGRQLAYADAGSLLVARAGAAEAERVATGVATTEQAPAWSPAGDRLLVTTDAPAVLELASGTLTPLPGALRGQQFRWSGDGSRLVFATSSCTLAVALSADGSASAPVQNPDAPAACRPTSVDVTGQRVTVPLDTDAATADAVVDTSTGEQVRLPVAGTVVGVAFDPDGNLLVRAVDRGVTRLSLFEPDGTLLVQAAEPASVAELDLLAYTR